MTKKVLGYVRLVWPCPRCGTFNPGSQKFCNGCGGPQPENVEFQQPPAEELVTGAEEVARARAAPDVHCPYCGARNPAVAKFCGECGGDLRGAAQRSAGRILGAHRTTTGPVICAACGTTNPHDRTICRQCGAPLAVPGPGATPPPTPMGGGRRWLAPAGALGAALLLGGILLLALRTDEVRAQVASVRWERTIEVEQLGPVERAGWRDEMPLDAVVGACTLEHRETRDEPAPRATEVCGTAYTVDTGTGYGEVRQDCVYEVYAEYCPYTVEDWVSAGVFTEGGHSLPPAWPDVALSQGQRERGRSESFEVLFTAGDSTYRLSPQAETEFRLYIVGSEWLLEVNALGGVISASPAP